jgi:hypothetical protein
MGPNANKPDDKTEAKENLKSLPMPELQTKLGSSPDGLSMVLTRSKKRKSILF